MATQDTADLGVEIVKRVLDLLEDGESITSIRAAISRSSDVYDLGMLIGLLEDIRASERDVEPAF